MGGRFVRVYHGAGAKGERAAAEGAAHRAARAAQAEAWNAERARLEAVDAVVERLTAGAESAARVALLLAGYRRHARGAWRKRRVQSHG